MGQSPHFAYGLPIRGQALQESGTIDVDKGEVPPGRFRIFTQYISQIQVAMQEAHTMHLIYLSCQSIHHFRVIGSMFLHIVHTRRTGIFLGNEITATEQSPGSHLYVGHRPGSVDAHIQIAQGIFVCPTSLSLTEECINDTLEKQRALEALHDKHLSIVLDTPDGIAPVVEHLTIGTISRGQSRYKFSMLLKVGMDDDFHTLSSLLRDKYTENSIILPYFALKITPTMRKCYISRNYKAPRTAGGKAKMDIERIMQQMGFVNLGLRQTTHTNKVVDFLLTLLGVLKAALLLRQGDALVLQYPMKKYYEWMCNVAHRRGAKIITQIHDLGSFRRKRLTVEREIQRLNHSDVIIVHNEHMQAWLEEQGCRASLVILGIFDYLSDEFGEAGHAQKEPVSSKRELPQEGDAYSLFFLGNVGPAQNRFLYALGEHLHRSTLYLYGGGFEPSLAQPSLKSLGFGIDTELMRMNKGDFGLSWYGDSLTEGKGRIGEYMNYNNPHKVSLYLRCHAPVILSKHAGLADFIERNGIGLCVEDLSSIEERLSKITPATYRTMYDNVVRVAGQLAQGHYFRTAVTEALSRL